jgi:hypothetical protein
MPSPVGRRIKKANFLNEFYKKIQEHPQYNPTVRNIVKAADFLEALIFLAVERSMGNNSLNDIYDDVYKNYVDHMVSCNMERHAGRLAWHCSNFARMQQDPLNDDISQSADRGSEKEQGPDGVRVLDGAGIRENPDGPRGVIGTDFRRETPEDGSSLP